jgi:O-antigen/teichoic acid export membrane protein
MASAADIGSVAHAPPRNRARASVGGAAWSALNTAIGTLATAALFLVSSRYLGPHEFGLVALATSVVTIASALAPAAFGEALVQRREIGARHLDTIFWLCLLAGGLLYFAVLWLARPIAGWLGEPVLAALLPVIGVKLAFEMAAVTPTALIVRSMKFRAIAIRTALANLAAAVVCLTLLLLGYGLWSLALAQVANVAVAATVVMAASGWRPGFRLSLQAFRELASYGTYASATRALNVLRLDQLLVGALGGALVAGLFTFANRLFQMLTGLISGAFGSVTHALLSSMQAEREKVREAFLIATFGSSLAAFPIFAGLTLVAPEAIPAIFGAQWSEAVVPVQAFAVIGLVASVGVVQGALLTSQGQARGWFWYQAAVQLANLPLILVLMPWGLDAVLIGIAAKTVALWPLSVGMALRCLGIGLVPYLRNLAVPVIATAAMGWAVLSVDGLAFRILAGAAVYTATALLLGGPRLWAILKRVKARKSRP